MGEIKLLAFDLETPQVEPSYGLQPWRLKTGEAVIQSYAAWSEDGIICGAKKRPSVALLRGFLQLAAVRGYTLVGWNVLFDVAWLVAAGLMPELKKCQILDAMLLLKHVDPWLDKAHGGPGFGLKSAVARAWPEHAAYAAEVDVTLVPETAEEWTRLLRYNLDDSRFTGRLAREYLNVLSQSEVQNCLIEASSIPDVALSYINGIHINEAAIKPFREQVQIMQDEAMPVFGATVDVVRSPKKLAELLFDKWGYEPVGQTKTGNPSTDKESLMKLAIENPQDERFAALMKLRKCNTKSSKFLGGVIKAMEYHGEPVARPAPAISGTMTGRFVYYSTQGKNKGLIQTGIALHQWERDRETRDLLTAPPGYLLAEFDFSGQEMRLMAILSEDDVMLDLFANGGDGHAYMGASIEGVDYDWVRQKADVDKNAKAIRNLGKFCVMEGQPVLTERGLVPIEKIRLNDRVWDGVEWVTHSGAVYQGECDVMYYQGIWLTPDHYVWCEGRHEPERFYQAASQRLQLTRTGNGGRKIRCVDDCIRRDYPQPEPSPHRAGEGQMRRVRHPAMDYAVQSDRPPVEVLHPVQRETATQGDDPAIQSFQTQSNVAVWDITNAGPRRRYTVCDRLVSNSNLSLQYRIGVDSIMSRALTQYNLQLSRHKAQHIKDTYLQTYKQVPQYWHQAINRATMKKYAASLGGRRIPLTDLNVYQQQQTAINFPIQATGGDMKALALAVSRNLFDNDFIYAWDLHDALFVYVKNDQKAKGRILAMQKILSHLPYGAAWGWHPSIDLPVDAKVGKTWGTLSAVQS
jgi:DNA polymerase I-like protein with 3'-5' exonuclease and polymerase domains